MGKEVYVKTVILIIFFKYYELFIPYSASPPDLNPRGKGRSKIKMHTPIMLSSCVVDSRRFGSTGSSPDF